MSCMGIKPLQMACALMVKTFDDYASKDGDPSTLSKSEVKQLLQDEMPMLLEVSQQQGSTDLMSDLDLNGDDKVCFQEFVGLVVSLSMGIHECLLDSLKQANLPI